VFVAKRNISAADNAGLSAELVEWPWPRGLRVSALSVGGKPMVRPKILSPVSSYAGALQVVAAGADEIYCAVAIPGAEHLLNRPQSCCLGSYDDLDLVSKHARSRGVKVVVTLELPFIADFMAEQMRNHVRSCVDAGADALIVGDVGLLLMVADMGLGIPVHASTLMGALNYEAVAFLRSLGASRVILERQEAIAEVQQIVRRNPDVEIEVFVHGGGCSNINANCYLTGQLRMPKDALLRLASEIDGPVKPCRYPYDIYACASGKVGTKIARTTVLDAFSYCSLCDLPALVNTGVTGLKIEGRCESVLYQVRTTRMYSQALDAIEQERTQPEKALMSLYDDLVKRYQSRPFLPSYDAKDGSLPRLRGTACAPGRCYYAPLFHVPYDSPHARKPR